MIETTELYDGEIQLQFDSARHQYRVINKGRKYKVPSVTAVCGIIAKPALIPWAVNATVDLCKGAISPGTEYAEVYLEGVWSAAKRASQTIKSEAASKGTALHRAIEESFDNGGIEPPSDLVLALRDWLSSQKLRVDENEQKIYSRRYRYSGTLDCIARDNNATYLLDWKTSKSIYPEFRLQTAAYVQAYEEEFPSQKIEGRYLVRIAEDGSVEPHYFPRSTQRRDFAAFLGAKILFDRIKQIERENKNNKVQTLR